MRHKVKGHKLSRDSGHRKALRRNMISDLICHEQIVTTEAKARMIRPHAEKVITMAKRGNAKDDAGQVHARRLAANRVTKSRVRENEDGEREEVDILKKLFSDIAPRYVDRNGGYTRMVKLGRRPGDNAKMAVVMLVEADGSDS